MSTIQTDKIIPVGSALTVEGAAVFTAGISANSTMILGGAATLSSTLNVSGATTLTTATTGLVTCSTAPSLAGHLCNKTYVDGTSSKTTSGYTKLPNGILIQWGVTPSIAIGGSLAITFSTPFSSACYSITVTPRFASATNSYSWSTNAPSTTGFTLYSQGALAGIYQWIAIGV